MIPVAFDCSVCDFRAVLMIEGVYVGCLPAWPVCPKCLSHDTVSPADGHYLP